MRVPRPISEFTETFPFRSRTLSWMLVIMETVYVMTGKVVWNERVGGNYSAAPVATREHLYFCSEEGRVTVVATGRTFSKIATNQLGDGFMASPAIVGNSLFLRGRSEVYRVD